MELLTLVPGAVVTNPDQFSVNTSLSATNQVVNGHRGNQNNMTVNGLEAVVNFCHTEDCPLPTLENRIRRMSVMKNGPWSLRT